MQHSVCQPPIWHILLVAQESGHALAYRRALNCLEALARGATDRASLNVFPRWDDHSLETNKGGFNSSGQQGHCSSPENKAIIAGIRQATTSKAQHVFTAQPPQYVQQAHIM